MLTNINVSELKKLIGSINIIDIRTKDEYDEGHIKTSINIPNSQLMCNCGRYLDKSKTYYIYCQFGKSSIKTCMYLNQLGYSVINIKGGFDEFFK
jgi:rhodanese-related sulfurtransferase